MPAQHKARISIIERESGKMYQVLLPTNVKTRQVLPTLVKQLRLPTEWPSGVAIAYDLTLETEDTRVQLEDSETLADGGVQDGSILSIAPRMMAAHMGGGWKIRNKDTWFHSALKKWEYLDFDIQVELTEGQYWVEVLNSPAGEIRKQLVWPYSELELENQLLKLNNALLLRSIGLQRVVLTTEEKQVRGFGQQLFATLLPEGVQDRYKISRTIAVQQEKGLRVKLRLRSPELAVLPWEFMFDHNQTEYVCLSRNTPIVRYLELTQVIKPLKVKPPLRILGMVASPEELGTLNVEKEKERVQIALKELQDEGIIELSWLPGQTWRDLQRAMRRGQWHIFHFIGHGGFNRYTEEGYIALSNSSGKLHRLNATQLGRLLSDHHSLRLALLNSCDGATGSGQDIFSSTAAGLLQRGIPAVVAMQYAITDRAAIEFARSFYESIADGLPVDTAVSEARISISLAHNHSFEWGTPVLHMRSPDGHLFDLSSRTTQ